MSHVKDGSLAGWMQRANNASVWNGRDPHPRVLVSVMELLEAL